jgi:serine/threonine-protein kinase
MAITSSGALVDQLRQLALLTAEQLSQANSAVRGRCGDARRLAKSMVQRGWISVYQMNALLAGKGSELVIGPYHIIDKLGQGGLSQVYKARHREYDLLVALKVLKAEALASPEGREQFLREMEAMAQLDHPNIVQFCDVDQAGDTFYFAMEFVDGTDLGKLVRLCGALPVHEACEYIRQTALGLQHAYERNLVHRDIKPVNLYVMFPAEKKSRRSKPAKERRHGVVKILDWGLAARRSPLADEKTGNPALTRELIGTADYISPEQASNAHAVDIRGDIYSLGCTFYFLLTGRPPFPNGTLVEKLMKHQAAEPEPVSAFRNDVPEAVAAVLRRMISKNLDERFHTPAAVAMALKPFTQEPSRETAPSWRKRGLVPGADPAVSPTDSPSSDAETVGPASIP